MKAKGKEKGKRKRERRKEKGEEKGKRGRERPKIGSSKKESENPARDLPSGQVELGLNFVSVEAVMALTLTKFKKLVITAGLPMVPTLVAGTVGASLLFGSEEQSALCSPELCYIH